MCSRLCKIFLGSASLLVLVSVARAQFVAFNDHYSGPATHPNATTWNIWGTTAGAPGSSGPLKDIATGVTLPVILTITNYNAGANNLSLGPNPGSAAYNIFNGYIDFSSTTMYVMINLQAPLGASMGHVLSSLDSSKRYSVKLTAVRGGNYADRWTLMELVGATAFTAAHTAGSYTNGLLPNQVAINTGENRANGATAVWTDIDPGDDGIVAIVSRQYTGALPGGGSGGTGTYGYGPIALRVEEFPGAGNSPARIVTQPVRQQQIFEGNALQLTVSVSGSAPIMTQWFKDGSAISNATNNTLFIANTTVSNTGTYFALATNAFGGATSSNAVVNVLGKRAPILRLLEFTNQWRFDQSGTDRGLAWRPSGYDDSAWNVGRGLFAYTTHSSNYPEPTNTILAQVDGSGNSILTYYFRTHFNWPISSTNAVLVITNLLDDGAVFYLNNAELMRIRLPSGAISYATAADSAVGDGTIYEPTNTPGTALLAGDNVLAVEVHQYIAFSSDATFGMNVRAYALPSEPLVILSQPSSMIANEEEPVVFRAEVFGGGNVNYQWLKDGAALPNATNQTLRLAEVHPTDQGNYSFIASNGINSVTSSNAHLAVVPDTVRPRIIAAYFTNQTTVIVQFSEAVDPSSATNISAYAFSPAVTIYGVVMETASAVRISAAQFDSQFSYTVTITGVRDKATSPNEIAPGSSARVLTSFVVGNTMLAVQTVFVIIMENHDWSAIQGNPYCPYINNVLLPMASYATQFYTPNDLHPSEPNYIWMEAGSNYGILDDAEPSVNHLATTNHLTTLLRNAGISWKTYQENIPGDTCPVNTQYPYAARHNPFVYFDDIIYDFNYCTNHNRPFTELADDLANGTVAAYNFITPNVTNDMHDYAPGSNSSAGQGDYWLSLQMPMILNSAAYTNNGAVFITWDEGSTASPIGMICLSPLAKGGGYYNSIRYNHGSLLRSMQEIFGVGPLLGNVASVSSLSDFFKTLSLSPVLTNGEFAVRVENMLRSKTYYLQASPDLRNWTGISTNSGVESITIADPAASTFNQRFYRLIQAR